MDFAALFPPLAPLDEPDESVDIGVDDIRLPALEQAVDAGIYRALRVWNERDAAASEKALPYAERVRKYQRVAAIALQPAGEFDPARDCPVEQQQEEDAASESELEADRAAAVAKEKEKQKAQRRQATQRRRLQREHARERERFRAVLQQLEDVAQLRAARAPSARVQSFVATFAPKKRRLAMKRSAAATATAASFEFARPALEAHEERERAPLRDADPVLWFDVLHPSKDPARTQSFLVRRSQRVAELVDLVACANDERLHEHAKKSKLVYFGRRFFVDRHGGDCEDYSTPIVRWIRAKPEREAKFGAFTGAATSLHVATFADLELHVDVPGVYIHQGECEHLLRLRDARLPHELDAPTSDGVFPLRLPNPLNRPLRNCLICQHYTAKYVCYGDRLSMMDPMFFCHRCYRAAHYDASGKLLYNDFLSFPFVQD
ncbi:unnamed protein product [Phytophthora fragariaefolia]|uniref:Unnamed protein product n=1 Tax=Phytophthora fragariaefolia TaxID=1490495 RepID=A0A9W6X8B8_9STRA|nr:unnamed protein product [Phytophthora fragariaefolia]